MRHPENKHQKVLKLEIAIRHLHNCAAIHRGTESVRELIENRTVWKGVVEIFDLQGHPLVKSCYAWMQRDEKTRGTSRAIVVLEFPPITSAEVAIRYAKTERSAGA